MKIHDRSVTWESPGRFSYVPDLSNVFKIMPQINKIIPYVADLLHIFFFEFVEPVIRIFLCYSFGRDAEILRMMVNYCLLPKI